MATSRVYWNPETINHFQFISSYLSGEELYEKVQEFIEVDCVMQNGDTEEELINNLLKEINGIN